MSSREDVRGVLERKVERFMNAIIFAVVCHTLLLSCTTYTLQRKRNVLSIALNDAIETLLNLLNAESESLGNLAFLSDIQPLY